VQLLARQRPSFLWRLARPSRPGRLVSHGAQLADGRAERQLQALTPSGFGERPQSAIAPDHILVSLGSP